MPICPTACPTACSPADRARLPACQPAGLRPQPPPSLPLLTYSLDEFTTSEGAEPILTEVTLDMDSGAASVRRLADGEAAYGDFPVVHPGLVGEWLSGLTGQWAESCDDAAACST